MITVGDVRNFLDEIAPFETAMDWDNSGLLLGDAQAVITGIMVALDVTPSVLEEAAGLGSNLVVSHHPVIFSPLRRLGSGDMAYKAVRRGIHVLSAHTNLDVADWGVNHVLGQVLGLRDAAPLAPDGLGRIGLTQKPMWPQELAEFVKERLGCGGVRFCEGREQITCLAVCGGSGGDLLDTAATQGAQAFVSADIKHDVYLKAHRLGMTLIDGGHFATENVIIKPLVEKLAIKFPTLHVNVAESCTEVCKWI